MSNHTPGPWHYGGYECIYADGPAQVVASVYESNLRGGVAEKQANARLIAAAPKLLAALKEAVEFADQDHHALTSAGEAMIDRWRTAIFKAEGKS